MQVTFSALPDKAKVWVFAARDPLRGEPAELLLREVDAWLGQWQAHGTPLTCGRDWRDDRFLAIGVDQTMAGASGCSIDALYRVLQRLQPALGTSLLAGGQVFYRDPGGAVQAADRPAFARLRQAGLVTDATPVFDTALTDAAAWRGAFERPLGESWHRELVARA
jgi:hypothetical protein